MHWEKVKLGDQIEILSGFAFESQRFNGDIGTPLIRIRDVGRDFSETYYDGDFDTKFLIQVGDLLVAMDGEFRVSEWKGANALLNQRVCKVTPRNTKKLDKRYLLYFLPFELKKIEDRTAFVTVKHLSVKDINSISIPLPPLPASTAPTPCAKKTATCSGRMMSWRRRCFWRCLEMKILIRKNGHL